MPQAQSDTVLKSMSVSIYRGRWLICWDAKNVQASDYLALYGDPKGGAKSYLDGIWVHAAKGSAVGKMPDEMKHSLGSKVPHVGRYKHFRRNYDVTSQEGAFELRFMQATNATGDFRALAQCKGLDLEMDYHR